MSRSRLFNRFHSYLAQQKRRGLRALLPQFKDSRDHQERSVGSSDDVLGLLNCRETLFRPAGGRGMSLSPGTRHHHHGGRQSAPGGWLC